MNENFGYKEKPKPVTAKELEDLKQYIFLPEGTNDGVINPGREVVTHLKPEAMYLCYRKVADDFTMILQHKGKSTGIPITNDQGLSIMYIFDPEAYQAVQKMRGK